VVSAAGLADFDDGLGESDPYVEVECNGRRARTSVVDGELDPVWGDRFALPCGAGAPLDVTVWDSDAMSDERIAVTTTTIPNVAVEQTLEWTVPLGAEATSHVVLRAQGAALAP
jgi:Ca2+-dependent lipid-binding protein